jgi:Tfp pilus assembly ATPase PilU
MAAIDISPILKFMLEKGGSDLFFSTGAAIHIEVEGETLPINAQLMVPGMIKEIAYSLMSPDQIAEFESILECNFAISKKDVGRFRVNVFRQRGEVGMVVRHIISFFPEDARTGLLLGLSMNLVSIISQRLIPGKQSKRVAATEVMINTPYIAELIQKQKMGEMKEIMADSNDIGMTTFDQSLFRLFGNGKIDEENALANADSRNDLSLKMRFAAEGARNSSFSS